uniref:Phosphoprotein P n=1 Tax=Oak-Vale virus TaxID=318852 RepID=D8V089_9RHAB|nr:phosphoprotein P [Oak-Vale virus]
MNLSPEQLTELSSFVTQHQLEDDEDSLAEKVAKSCSISEKVFPPNPSDTEGEIMDYQSSGESDGQANPSLEWDHSVLARAGDSDHTRPGGSLPTPGPSGTGGPSGLIGGGSGLIAIPQTPPAIIHQPPVDASPPLIPAIPSQVTLTLADAMSLFNSVLAKSDEGSFYLEAGQIKYLSKKKQQNLTRSVLSGPDSPLPGMESSPKPQAVSRGCQTTSSCIATSKPPTPPPRRTLAANFSTPLAPPEKSESSGEREAVIPPTGIAWNPFCIFPEPPGNKDGKEASPESTHIEEHPPGDTGGNPFVQNPEGAQIVDRPTAPPLGRDGAISNYAGSPPNVPRYSLTELRVKSEKGFKIKGLNKILTIYDFRWDEMTSHQGKFPLKFWLRFANI